MSDEDILDRIFHPEMAELPLPTATEVTNEEADARAAEAALAARFDQAVLSKLRKTELEAIKHAEKKEYNDSLRLLNEVIALEPSYPSAYNNRAQIHQLMGQLPAALDDVNRAIELASNPPDRTVLRQSYTQRGLIHKAMGKDDPALQDYQRGASFGNAFAKQESVRLNPYAALCNQYLAQALQNHWSGLGPSAATPQQQLNDAMTGSSTCASSNASCSNTAEEQKK